MAYLDGCNNNSFSQLTRSGTGNLTLSQVNGSSGNTL
jgi:hypothetical protein